MHLPEQIDPSASTVVGATAWRLDSFHFFMQLQNTLSGLLPRPGIDGHAIEPEEASRERILIVDDSATVRRALANFLSAEYDCAEAASVLEAFQLLKEVPYELVITDIIMPGLSGIELVRKVIDSYPHTAVMVVSGVDRPQRALDAVRLGAFDYLIKPLDNEVLGLTVKRALERRSLLINAKKYKADLEARNDELIRGKQQLERLQAQIVQNEKMASIGQLAAGIAHELNNPVGFLYGNIDLLDGSIQDLLTLVKYYDQVDMPAEIAAGAEEIKTKIAYRRTLDDLEASISDCREGAERVRDIVQNLRTFSRLDEAEIKRADIHEGIESTVRILSRYFSGGNISLERRFGVLPMIESYPAQLNQVWMNLLVNAAQSVGGNSGTVSVETSADHDSVHVSISDTGGGIAPETLKKIFDPFFTTKPVGEGTGLGLSISFGIVEKHGGRIDVESEPGHGSTFTVTLPIRMRETNETTPDLEDRISQNYSEVNHAFAI